jgi:hypothetical protein
MVISLPMALDGCPAKSPLCKRGIITGLLRFWSSKIGIYPKIFKLNFDNPAVEGDWFLGFIDRARSIPYTKFREWIPFRSRPDGEDFSPLKRKNI